MPSSLRSCLSIRYCIITVHYTKVKPGGCTHIEPTGRSWANHIQYMCILRAVLGQAKPAPGTSSASQQIAHGVCCDCTDCISRSPYKTTLTIPSAHLQQVIAYMLGHPSRRPLQSQKQHEAVAADTELDINAAAVFPAHDTCWQTTRVLYCMTTASMRAVFFGSSAHMLPVLGGTVSNLPAYALHDAAHNGQLYQLQTLKRDKGINHLRQDNSTNQNHLPVL